MYEWFVEAWLILRFFENIGFSYCKGIGAGSITENINVKDFQKILGEFTKNMNVWIQYIMF